jgi:hypothetical protein
MEVTLIGVSRIHMLWEILMCTKRPLSMIDCNLLLLRVLQKAMDTNQGT